MNCNKDKCYLIVRANPCCSGGEEFVGIFDRSNLIEQYAISLVELVELQREGYYPNYELYIYEFEKNSNDEGRLVRLQDFVISVQMED